MEPQQPPERTNDTLLEQVMQNEGNNIAEFLNAVFGFLSRRCPEKVFGRGVGGGGGKQITGEHLVSQSFCRWKQMYQQQQQQKQKQKPEDRLRTIMLSDGDDSVPEAVIEEEVISHVREEEKATNNNNNSRDEKESMYNVSSHCNLDFDTTNGASLPGLAWTQGIDDLEVRVTVPRTVTRGKQVKVRVGPSSLMVVVMGDGDTGTGGAGRTLLEGSLLHPVRAQESLWSLSPAEYITIQLEKCEERWWDRLLTQHEPIDLGKINAERDYGSLPEDERNKIQELMWNKWQKEQGKPTSEQLRMESVLQKAWTAEGSPFLGQPYDPSSVTVVGSGFPTT